MAETANIIIKDALFDLQVQQDEAPLEATDARAAIRALNRMMNAFASDGINLGFTEVSQVNDPITVPAGALGAIVSNLAIELAPQYLSGEPTQRLLALAAQGKKILYKLGVEIGDTEYPDTLPRGSGNEDPCGTYDTFYPDQQPAILSESNGSISIDDYTEEA